LESAVSIVAVEDIDWFCLEECEAIPVPESQGQRQTPLVHSCFEASFSPGYQGLPPYASSRSHNLTLVVIASENVTAVRDCAD
jgi:hypothetical protein